MRRKIALIAISLFAILILIGIQSFLVFRIYNLESEKFDYRYRELVNEAVNRITVENNSNGLTKSFFILDKISIDFIKFLQFKNEVDTITFQKTVVQKFYDGLLKFQDFDNAIAKYLQKLKVKEHFQSYFRIRTLYLINNREKFSILNSKTKSSIDSVYVSKIPHGAILVNHNKFLGNNFIIDLEYYVDFSHKKHEVLSQIYKSITLTGISLLIVISVFFLTTRNLLKERRLSQMKTDFINNMTHELKTPLSTISVASKTLESEQIHSNPVKVLETAKIISRQNIHLTRQINHLLEITKWEKKQFDLDKKWIELEPFFKGVIESFKWDCKDKSVIINENYSFDTKKAFFDETQITSAIINILSNGIKYNDNQPIIHLKVWTDDQLHISISDNGIGISKDLQKHIFEKFYRVHTGNIHTVKGLGLGLFYVDQIVKAHNGTIDLISKIEKGSTFTLNIPIDGKNKNITGRR